MHKQRASAPLPPATRIRRRGAARRDRLLYAPPLRCGVCRYAPTVRRQRVDRREAYMTFGRERLRAADAPADAPRDSGPCSAAPSPAVTARR
eukprot:360488-Chlamydomonas_euryale.AAC.19